MRIATERERWGGFQLVPDAATEPKTTDVPARRGDFRLAEEDSLWRGQFATVLGEETAARGDPHVPLPQWLPATESFLAASVLADQVGAAAGAVAYISLQEPDVARYARPDGRHTGDDNDLLIQWSTIHGQPAYVTFHSEPLAIDGSDLAAPTVVELPIRKIHVRGHEGIMRIWEPAEGAPSMYGRRLPTVIINWWEEDVLWSLQSTFLTPEEALRVAESIRPTQTH